MSINHNFSADKPIEKENDDQFQRYSFSKRIAETIIERKSTDCIVIGIYGAWGEGKTSVINFIEAELKGKENILSFKFNPWRFSDESALLIQFFQQLAKVLQTNIKTKAEKLGEVITDYSGLLNFDAPVVGKVGGALKIAAKFFNKPSLEQLKKRVEDALVKANIKVVVFIDDIDRLDKDELHAIFRLVKLNADFSNITYLLAFDEKMVASAISQRFGNNEIEAGQSFLEKIIQVPLKIPVAQPTALKKFSFKLVEEVLENYKIDIPQNELSRFASEFANHILIVLDTPRLAVRYSNSISFSLPLLKGEVNIADLLLIEALKIFYPAYYLFIKENAQYFLDTYTESDKQNVGKKDMIKQEFERLGANLSRSRKLAIKDLLLELFPMLKEAFLNYQMSGYYMEWYQQKRICSAFYFNRYFTYSVIKGEISDIEFDGFLSEVETVDPPVLISQMKDFFRSTSAETFLKKLRMLDSGLPHSKLIILGRAMVKISDDFQNGSEDFGLFTLQRNLSGYLKSIVQRYNDEDERIHFVLDLIGDAQSFSFAYELFFWLKPNTSETDVLSPEQFSLMGDALLKRALTEAGELPLFEKFPNSVHKVFAYWKTEDPAAFKNYLIAVLNKDPSATWSLVNVLAAHIVTSGNSTGQTIDITQEHFQYLLDIIDMDVLIDYINNYLKLKRICIEEPEWTKHDAAPTRSTENLMFQLIWYNNLRSKST